MYGENVYDQVVLAEIARQSAWYDYAESAFDDACKVFLAKLM